MHCSVDQHLFAIYLDTGRGRSLIRTEENLRLSLVEHQVLPRGIQHFAINHNSLCSVWNKRVIYNWTEWPEQLVCIYCTNFFFKELIMITKSDSPRSAFTHFHCEHYCCTHKIIIISLNNDYSTRHTSVAAWKRKSHAMFILGMILLFWSCSDGESCITILRSISLTVLHNNIRVFVYK